MYIYNIWSWPHGRTSSGQSQSPATWDAFQSGLGITAWYWRSPKYQREKMEHVMGNSTTGINYI